MKKHLLGLYFLLLIMTASFAQSDKLVYTIAPWYNDKKAAVSLTFDDGISGQFTDALPLLNAHHFRATFFVTTQTLIGQLGSWQLVTAAVAAGHEIANHARTHPHFNAVPADTIASELVLSNALIEANTQPNRSLTHAYPYGEGGQETPAEIAARAIVKKYFIGARATRNKATAYNGYNFAKTDDDYFTINSDMIADSASMAGFAAQLDAAISAGGWYVPTYHGIVTGWIITPKNIFEIHLNDLEKRKDLCWIAPFADVLKYHKERNCASLSIVTETKHQLTLALTDTLSDTKTWNQPLTIHLKKGNREIKKILQDGFDIPFTNTTNEVIFNAIPGVTPLCLKKNKRLVCGTQFN